MFRRLRPRTPLPEIRVEFRQFANVNSFIEWNEGGLEVRLSDLMASAPEPVQEALAWILLSKLFRRPVPAAQSYRYRRFWNRKDMSQALEAMRRERGRKRMLPPEGKTYNLIEIFENLNFRFFHGLMSRPEIGWSAKVSRSLLGHYDSAHHAIVISAFLDEPGTPLEVLEYVLYHEMLHLRFPVERRGARRCVHTAEFRKAEDEFPEVDRVKRRLEELCRT